MGRFSSFFFTETHREKMIDDVPRKQMKYVYAKNEIIVKIPAMSMSDLHLRWDEVSGLFSGSLEQFNDKFSLVAGNRAGAEAFGSF